MIDRPLTLRDALDLALSWWSAYSNHARVAGELERQHKRECRAALEAAQSEAMPPAIPDVPFVPAPLSELETEQVQRLAEHATRATAQARMTEAMAIVRVCLVSGLQRDLMDPGALAYEEPLTREERRIRWAEERARNIAHSLAHLIAPGVDL